MEVFFKSHLSPFLLYKMMVQVTHNSASFYVEAFDRNGNAVHGFIGEHLPLQVGKNLLFCCLVSRLSPVILPSFSSFQVSVSSNNAEIKDVEIIDTGHGYVLSNFCFCKC